MIKSGHGGDLTYYAEKYQIAREELVDFSANINPLGPPLEIFDIIKDSFKIVKDYPEPNSTSLLNIAEKKFGVKRQKMIFGNGASELLFLLLNYLRPKKAFIPRPTFSEYERAARAVGASIEWIDFEEDFKKLDQSFLSNVASGDIIFICNPNNPTASYFTKDEILEILKLLEKKGAYLFLDESFADFIDPDKEGSLRKELENYNNLFILYSLTKIYAIPGLRLGLLFGGEAIISQLYQAKDPWNLNIFAQKTGEYLLKDKEFIKESSQYFSQERKRVFEAFKKIPSLKTYEPAANFIFFEILNDKNAEDLQEFLIRHKIMIRNCANYPALSEKHFRTAIKGKEENDLLIKNIAEYFTERS